MARRENDGELVGSFEVGSFVGVEDHEIIADMKTAVNKPLTGLPTEHSQRVFGERFEIIKRKMGATINPHGEMSAVQKKWKGIQKPLGGDIGEVSTPTRYKPSEEYQPEGKQDLSPLGVLKNMVDNHANDIRNWGNWTKLGLILGTVGVCGFIMALAIILK